MSTASTTTVSISTVYSFISILLISPISGLQLVDGSASRLLLKVKSRYKCSRCIVTTQAETLLLPACPRRPCLPLPQQKYRHHGYVRSLRNLLSEVFVPIEGDH